MIQNWYECLTFGKIGEDLAKKQIKNFMRPIIETYDYEDFKNGRDKQRNGMDFKVTMTDFTVDVKTRDFRFWPKKDILVETKSVMEDNVDGWYYTSQSDYIFYTWLNIQKTDFHDARIIPLKQFRSFVDDYIKMYDIKYRISSTFMNGRVYHTQFFTVGLNEFPEGLLINCDISKLNKYDCTNDSNNDTDTKFNCTNTDTRTDTLLKNLTQSMLFDYV